MLLESRADMEFARNVAEVARHTSRDQKYEAIYSNSTLFSFVQKIQEAGGHIDQVVKLNSELPQYMVLYTL